MPNQPNNENGRGNAIQREDGEEAAPGGRDGDGPPRGDGGAGGLPGGDGDRPPDGDDELARGEGGDRPPEGGGGGDGGDGDGDRPQGGGGGPPGGGGGGGDGGGDGDGDRPPEGGGGPPEGGGGGGGNGPEGDGGGGNGGDNAGNDGDDEDDEGDNEPNEARQGSYEVVFDPMKPLAHLLDHERKKANVSGSPFWQSISSNLETLFEQRLSTLVFKEYTGIEKERDFGVKAARASAEELALFQMDPHSHPPRLEKPVRFDTEGGGGSPWNKKVCKLLAEQCILTQRSDPPIVKLSNRVRLPQMEAILILKFQRSYHSFSRFQRRPTESEPERQTRMIDALQRVASCKRGQSSRKEKLRLRKKAVDTLIQRGESLTAMRFAKNLLDNMKADGMSSEDDMNDANGTFIGFKTSRMDWRSPDVTNILHKIDDIERQLRDPRGAIRQSRFPGEPTRRKAMRNLTSEMYEEGWLEREIERGNALIRRGSFQGWMSFDTWERCLR